MTLALAVVMGGYVALVGFLAWRAGRDPEAEAPLPEADLPSVAVIVAARDEEAVIERCVEALLAQDYPADRLQILVADDHSTDRTAHLVRRAQTAASPVPVAVPAGVEEMPEREGPDLHCVRVPAPRGELRGKANALHAAIEASDAEVILITDADCAPVATWARGMATRLAAPGVGLVCGLTRVDARPERASDRIQALDWAFLLGAVSTLAEAGTPATGMGNNMGVRRATYEAVGGYPALPFSLNDDFTLVRAVVERSPWDVRFPISPETTVWTLPTDSLAGAYAQRRRWARGGLSDAPWVLPVFAAIFLTHALPLVGVALAPMAGLLAIGAKVGVDGLFLRAVLRRAGGRFRWADLPAFEAFLFGYLTTLPVALTLRPSVDWKGRRH